jgi:hypothetical protein
MASTPESSTDPDQTPATAPVASSKNIFKAFAQHITIKLDENNFLSWKQQVEGIIRTHKLHRHLVNPIIPPRYLSLADNAADNENPAYTEWEQKDSLLFTWLLTTLSDSVLPRVVRCVQAHEVWTAIDVFYRTQITAKSRELRSELKCIMKGEKSISEFLARIQQIANILESIGDPISLRDHMEAILEGLPEEYNAISTVIQYRESDGPCPVLVAEAMLLSHEARLERMKKSPLPDLVSVNVAQATPEVSASSSSSKTSQGSSYLILPITLLNLPMVIVVAVEAVVAVLAVEEVDLADVTRLSVRSVRNLVTKPRFAIIASPLNQQLLNSYVHLHVAVIHLVLRLRIKASIHVSLRPILLVLIHALLDLHMLDPTMLALQTHSGIQIPALLIMSPILPIISWIAPRSLVLNK